MQGPGVRATTSEDAALEGLGRPRACSGGASAVTAHAPGTGPRLPHGGAAPFALSRSRLCRGPWPQGGVGSRGFWGLWHGTVVAVALGSRLSFPRGEAPPPWSLPEAGPRAESRLPRAVTSPRSEGESALAVFLRHVRGLEAHDFAQVLQKPEPSHLSCQRRRWLSPKLRASSARRGPPGRLGLAAAVLCALPRAAGPPCAVSTGWLALPPLPRPRPDTRSPPPPPVGCPPGALPGARGPGLSGGRATRLGISERLEAARGQSAKLRGCGCTDRDKLHSAPSSWRTRGQRSRLRLEISPPPPGPELGGRAGLGSPTGPPPSDRERHPFEPSTEPLGGDGRGNTENARAGPVGSQGQISSCACFPRRGGNASEPRPPACPCPSVVWSEAAPGPCSVHPHSHYEPCLPRAHDLAVAPGWHRNWELGANGLA